jgi:D-lactate dehydrogenase (cytochrome)
MRPVLRASRALPAPCVPYRPRISPRQTILTRGARLNSSIASEKTKEQSDSSSNFSNTPPSPFWTPTKALLVSAFAAGLGYGYASYAQTTQKSTEPEYASTKDFALVKLPIASHTFHLIRINPPIGHH